MAKIDEKGNPAKWNDPKVDNAAAAAAKFNNDPKSNPNSQLNDTSNPNRDNTNQYPNNPNNLNRDINDPNFHPNNPNRDTNPSNPNRDNPQYSANQHHNNPNNPNRDTSDTNFHPSNANRDPNRDPNDLGSWPKPGENQPATARPKVATFDNVDVDNDKFMYPFFSTEIGQGFFVANEPRETTAQTLAKLHSHVAYANDWYSEIELDQNGDEVWEEVFVKSTKRNPNGSLQRESNGNIIYGHDPVSRPNYIYSRRYVARVIAKDDLIAGKKSEADGVLIVRVV